MARGKKKESALTPEEKLAQALVPDWEQPYKVPNNWKWIILGNLVDIHRGASPRPIKAYITEDETGVNWIKIGDTDSGKYVTRVSEKITTEGARKSVFVEEGTLDKLRTALTINQKMGKRLESIIKLREEEAQDGDVSLFDLMEQISEE